MLELLKMSNTYAVLGKISHNEKALKKWGIRSTHFQYTENEK